MSVSKGLDGVLVTETRLSRVDGLAGELTIGGFPLEELAPNATYEEAVFLLWEDRLPTAAELKSLQAELAAQRGLPGPTIDILRAAAGRSLPPMDALRMGADTLSLADPDPTDSSPAANLARAKALVSRVATIVATYWRVLRGRTVVEPRSDLRHAANYLYMLRGTEADPDEVRGLETYINTVVDHGMNNSTFAARVIISTGSDMISAIVGAIGSLKGPLHGGAPGPALDMVFELRERAAASGKSLEAEAEAYVRETVEAGGRIMGFGHRVYKVRDPRADVLGAAAERLFKKAGDIQLNQDARAVEQVVLRVLEELKPGRGLKTNVEFYTALVLHGLGFETALFTPTFAVGRVGGWTAQVLEQIAEARLIRPGSGYRGVTDRTWVPLEQRRGSPNR
jgi:citrate synthase